jgi:hypothetical protein
LRSDYPETKNISQRRKIAKKFKRSPGIACSFSGRNAAWFPLARGVRSGSKIAYSRQDVKGKKVPEQREMSC